MSEGFTTFTNCRLCLHGELVESRLTVAHETGRIIESTGYIGGDIIDLDGAIIAPGFLELHTNGVRGFHYTHFKDSDSYNTELERAAQYYVSQGVTGWWATIPTVDAETFQTILPSLRPRDFKGGASLLGAHCEGSYLAPSKKGAHNSELFVLPDISPSAVYGASNLSTSIKLVTIAPELVDATTTIRELVSHGIKVSMGHSATTFADGVKGLTAGATCLTHVLNAMSPLNSREPGLAGLITLPPTHQQRAPYYSIIPDGHHLHPSTLAFLWRAAPNRAILITDSIELAGLRDGVYPGHKQIAHNQLKRGNLVTIEGTDTLIGGCISLQECARNLMQWTGCGVAQAVRSVTENVASLMDIHGDGGRGVLLPHRRADFVILNDDCEVLQTWMNGIKVWEKAI